MIEAMACGTPVIAFNRGSVPEMVSSKVGIRVNNGAEMIEAVKLISKIDRKACREEAMNRYGAEIIAKKYLDI